MRYTRSNILKTCIALCIIAIVISVFVQYGLPFFYQQYLQSLDQERISNLDTLNTLISPLLGSSTQADYGSPNVVYISIPSASSTCGDLDLPQLETGWQYHCVTASTLQNTNGKGWLPIDFSSYVEASSSLPIDPINTSDSLNYYAFISNRTATSTEYILTATLHSKKYLSSLPADNIDPSRIAVGNDEGLLAKAIGLIGYWPFDDGNGKFAPDATGNSGSINVLNNNMFATPTECGQSVGCIQSQSSQDALIVPIKSRLSQGADISYGFRFRISKIPQSNQLLFNPGTYRLDTDIEGSTGALFVWFYDNNQTNNQIFKSSANQFTDGGWHEIYITKDSDSIAVYIDGQQVQNYGTMSASYSDLPNGTLYILPNMSVSDLRVYNIAITDEQVAAIFASSK